MNSLSKMRKIIGGFIYFLAACLTGILICPLFISKFNVLGQRWAFILILSACISFLLTPIFRSLAKKLHILDIPGGRKAHNEPTPLLGGLSIYCGFTFSLGVYAVLSPQLRALLVAGTIILGIGLLDDCQGASATLKLLLQALAVGVVIYNGIHFVFFPASFWGHFIEIFLTILWILGITNAVNFLDGMDGLAAGSSAIMAFYLGIVAFQSGQHFWGWALVAIVGSCLGFLPFNLKFQHASIFLGDAGSTFLGFLLACLAIMGNWGTDNFMKTFTPPLLIFGILIFDLIHISFYRILSQKVTTFKEWIDFVGKDHLHHRLENLGMTRKEVVLFIFLFEICLGAGADNFRQIHPVQGMLLLLQGVGIIVLFTILEHLGNEEVKKEYKKTWRDYSRYIPHFLRKFFEVNR